jgi:hypothetical protein
MPTAFRRAASPAFAGAERIMYQQWPGCNPRGFLADERSGLDMTDGKLFAGG